VRSRRFAARVSVAAVLALVISVAACEREAESEGVRLRFEYREGDTLRYSYESDGTVTIPDTAAAGGTIERSYQRSMRIEEVAEDVTPRDRYRLAVTYHLPPDTATGEAPAAPITIHLEMTPQGKIQEVSGVETAKPLFGDIDFQSYFEQAQPVFPDRPLKVGDSWTQEVKVMAANSEPVVTTSTYVLKALTEEDGEPVAIIAFDGEIYLPIGHGASATGPAMDAPQLAEERIRVQGTLTFAHERGVVRRVETTSRATVTKLAVEGGETIRRDLHIQERSQMRLIEE
jgi:hypothetical protein